MNKDLQSMKKVIGFEGNIINKSIGKGNPTMFLQTDLLKLREEMIRFDDKIERNIDKLD